MEVQLTADQKALAQDAMQAGRVQDETDVVQQALALWEARERTRFEILAAVDSAEASLARGQGRIISEQSMAQLSAEVKQRGRARWSTKQAAHS